MHDAANVRLLGVYDYGEICFDLISFDFFSFVKQLNKAWEHNWHCFDIMNIVPGYHGKIIVTVKAEETVAWLIDSFNLVWEVWEVGSKGNHQYYTSEDWQIS